MNVMIERRLRAAIRTQQEVANVMGVQISTVSKWKRGLAKLYICNIDDLLSYDYVPIFHK